MRKDAGAARVSWIRTSKSLACLASFAVLAVISAACGDSPPPPARSVPVVVATASAAQAVEQGPPVKPPPGWRRFIAEDEGFSVYMPGVPIATRGDDKGPILRVKYEDKDTGCIYAVSYNELDPAYVGHTDELFTKLKDDPSPGLTLLRDESTMADVVAQGHDYRFVDAAADTMLAMRVYVPSDHYYVIAVTFPRALFAEDAARTYLDTFRLLAPP